MYRYKRKTTTTQKKKREKEPEIDDSLKLSSTSFYESQPMESRKFKHNATSTIILKPTFLRRNKEKENDSHCGHIVSVKEGYSIITYLIF